MIHYAVAFGLLLHVLYWGAGAALLAMPHPWRRLWPVLIVPAGLALQSAVVWAGAHAGLRGTNSYAWWSELLPAILLAIAFRRRSVRSRVGLSMAGRPPGERRDWAGALRAAGTDLGQFGLVGATVCGVLAVILLPVALASKSLTTISLGSCDAADYAAGARVLMEFARGDREGFLGLTEVVRVGSADNFFDYWLRLNHFTPAALIAFNGSVLGCVPHELTTLFTAVVLAGTVPAVFWSARAIVGYNGVVSLIVGGFFGLSPVMWYAFAHVSPGQVLAAQGVVLLTWGGVALWRGRLVAGRVLQFGPVLAGGYWLVLGSYNFFLLLCLVPAVAYAGGLAGWTRAWARLARWVAWMLAPLAICAAVFNGRVTGLAERFSLLQTYDFGWRIPALTAEGWLGMVQGPGLEAWDFFGVRWGLSAVIVGLLGWAHIRAAQQRHRGAWTALAVSLPVLAGYWFLQIRGARLGTNASYDAYKLFTVFYPLLLPAFFWWVTLRGSRRLHEWVFVVAVGVFVAGFNLVACGMFVWKLSRPPLIVDSDLRQLKKIEAMADVRSVNMIFAESDMWSRLWANAFLLRKEQFFLTDTYEARWRTPLRGDWDLEGGLVALHMLGDGRREISPRFALVDTRRAGFLRVRIADDLNWGDWKSGNWHAEEFDPKTGVRWRWTKGDAALRIENPHGTPVTVVCTLDVRSISVTDSLHLDVYKGGSTSLQAVGVNRTKVQFSPMSVPAAGALVFLRKTAPAIVPPGDVRALGVCVFGIELEVVSK